MIVKDRQGNLITNGESQNNLLKKLYGTSLGRCALKILVCKPISDIGGLYMSSRLSKRRIQSFIDANQIDMSQYECKDYKSYNDFFTRRIKKNKRPYSHEKTDLMSPADSKLTYYSITKESLFNVKDTQYTLKDLLGDETLAKKFINGTCLIFRLTVDDYHRYSYVDNGQIVKRKFIKGLFHTVNPIANDYYPIYKTNSREYTIIESENFGYMIQMEVGAMMVGKIVNHDHQIATKGREKGYFEFGGSTIILLFQEGVLTIDQDIVENSLHDIETKVSLGETIGHKIGVQEDV